MSVTDPGLDYNTRSKGSNHLVHNFFSFFLLIFFFFFYLFIYFVDILLLSYLVCFCLLKKKQLISIFYFSTFSLLVCFSFVFVFLGGGVFFVCLFVFPCLFVLSFFSFFLNNFLPLIKKKHKKKLSWRHQCVQNSRREKLKPKPHDYFTFFIKSQKINKYK